MSAGGVVLRRLAEDDSLAELTALLHRAYAPLAAQGLRYVASAQDVEITRRRASAGECWVAESGGRIVGTITFYPPRPHSDERAPAFYRRGDVARFGQLAVDPGHQGGGIAARLLDLAERRAAEAGAVELACDTAESAAALIALYERRGYRIVDRADWRPSTNYASVVLARRVER